MTVTGIREHSEIQDPVCRDRILYVCPGLSSFVRSDIEALSGEFEVTVNTYNWGKKHMVPLYLVHQLFFLLFRIRSFKSVLISSGGYWSILPAVAGRLLSRPVHIILNGSDCAAIPQLQYGSLRSPLIRLACRTSYRMATRLLPVSSSLEYTENTYYSVELPTRQGFRHFFPEIRTASQVIHNGFDAHWWKCTPECEKQENTFVSVFSASQFILKGGDLITAVAGRFPSCRFTIAGMGKPPHLEKIPENLVFLGHLPPAELRDLFCKSRFYLQLSVFEGFGCALCEAMLCGCIPVGSAVNMIPDIIGDTGLILAHRDPEELEAVLVKALALPDKTGKGRSAAARIALRFPLTKRKEALAGVLINSDYPKQ